MLRVCVRRISNDRGVFTREGCGLSSRAGPDPGRGTPSPQKPQGDHVAGPPHSLDPGLSSAAHRPVAKEAASPAPTHLPRFWNSVTDLHGDP